MLAGEIPEVGEGNVLAGELTRWHYTISIFKF